MATVPDPDFGGNRYGGSRRPKRILAVDDERHIVRLVQVNLERAGYTVVTAFDGREALEKVESEQPDLVVLDVMMPYMDGFEVLQTLRKNQSTLNLPVIMLTAKAQDADVFRSWQSGVDCYLIKPFNPLELISFVRRLLDKDDDGGNGSAPVPAAPLPPLRFDSGVKPLPRSEND
jgi:two-component system alkaline phosphatase synthesis response regulator PhoP